MNKRLIHIATGVAISSPGIGKRNSYRVGAILFHKSRIINAKTNIRRTHPYLWAYTDYPFIHAETNCILSHGLDNCEGLNLLVVRVYKDNRTLSCAKPCEVCTNVIAKAGINKVYYSDWNGKITCEKVEKTR